MKGADARDALFARLFGLTALVQSKSLVASNSSPPTIQRVIHQLTMLGKTKGWLRESAWWTLCEAVRVLLDEERSHEYDEVVKAALEEHVYGDKNWSQEKVALTLILEDQGLVRGNSQDQRASLTIRSLTGRLALHQHSSTHLSCTVPT